MAVSDAFAQGGAGAEELARAVVQATEIPSQFRQLYALDASPEEKMATLAREIYGADGVDIAPLAQEKLPLYQIRLWSPRQCASPRRNTRCRMIRSGLAGQRGTAFPFVMCDLIAGAGFLYALAGDISTMPVCRPTRLLCIDLDSQGNIVGLT